MHYMILIVFLLCAWQMFDRLQHNRPIYMVVLASAVKGSFDIKIAQCNWTKMRTLKLYVYMALQNE